MSELEKTKKNIPKPTSFGKNLRFLRRLKGLSQTALAEHLGLSRNNIASYESGLVEPNATNFLKACAYFSQDPKDMLQATMSENPVEAVDIAPEDLDTKEKYIHDQISQFVVQTNEMTKVLEGYKTFYDLRKEMNTDHATGDLYATLDDLLILLSTLLQSNWHLIQSVFPSEEE